MDNGSSSNLQVRTLYLIKNHALFEETDDVISVFFDRYNLNSNRKHVGSVIELNIENTNWCC